mmetsp:Transcript_35777/g.54802  ORF Transcript_35777/g.54802 Transcript_35777/m.54802 type:complete len:266 (+) Transcript_35777:568-1365(+)
MPFTLIVDDPSGNSFIENPAAPTADQYCKKTHYLRDLAAYQFMGYPVDQATLQAEHDRLKEKQLEEINSKDAKFIGRQKAWVKQTKEEQEALLDKATAHATKPTTEAVAQAGYVDFSKSVEDQSQRNELAEDDPRKSVMKFPTPCYQCDKTGNVQMCFSSIPFFKEIIIMAFVCDFCGYRNSEIKEGGGIGDKAKRVTLTVDSDQDLNRDVFKSQTAKFSIPELEFDMEPGSLGSLYTTVEGLLAKLIEELELNNPFGQGDSAQD